ncbi:MAG: RND family efflux transporter MFP subunit [Kiritimatiellia bacterium]|jgi:RND family efflux transporter MFP subunit
MRFLICLCLAACSATPDLADAPIRPVRSVLVEEVGGALTGVFSGTTEAGDQATLAFPTPGSVESVDVRVGDRVTDGMVLARLDDSQLRLQVEQARAAVAQARANSVLSAQKLERTEALYLNNNSSASQVEAARASNDSARAALGSASQQIGIAKSQLERATLTAGRNGQVSRVLVREGEFVGGGTPVVVITPDEELQVSVMVPSKWIGRLARGDEARVRLSDLEDLEIPAKVVEVGVAGQNGSFGVTVEFLERDERLRPGMVASVSLTVGAQQETRIELPLSAVAEDSKGRYVWRIDPADDGLAHVHRVDVQTGALTATDGIVVTGIKPGSLVAKAGTSLLFEGRQVQVEAQ